MTTASLGVDDDPFDVLIRQIRYEADGVLSFQLQRRDGGVLPAWEPGTHVEVVLPSGLRRQYSLYGDPADVSAYRIATRLAPAGRGGSRELHRLHPGDTIHIAAVRNAFPLERADSYLFIAGGIGITPLLPMLRSITAQKISARFIYLGRNLDTMALVDDVTAIAPEAIVIQTDLTGIPHVRELLADCTESAIYACGPAALLDDLETESATLLGEHQTLHIERFEAAKPAPSVTANDTKIVCARSGIVVASEPDQTYLATLRKAGIDIPSSCEMGICGTCQVTVITGTPDHQDMLLTEQERATGAFLPCISRSQTPEITLDI